MLDKPEKTGQLVTTLKAAVLPKETDNVTILSLTHVQMHRSLPFAADVFDCQKASRRSSGP